MEITIQHLIARASCYDSECAWNAVAGGRMPIHLHVLENMADTHAKETKHTVEVLIPKKKIYKP